MEGGSGVSGRKRVGGAGILNRIADMGDGISGVFHRGAFQSRKRVWRFGNLSHWPRKESGGAEICRSALGGFCQREKKSGKPGSWWTGRRRSPWCEVGGVPSRILVFCRPKKTFWHQSSRDEPLSDFDQTAGCPRKAIASGSSSGREGGRAWGRSQDRVVVFSGDAEGG